MSNSAPLSLRLIFALATLSTLLVAGVGRAQTYRWLDEHGKEQTSARIDEVPKKALAGCRAAVVGVKAHSGDRFEIDGGVIVRLIGVDAPESESDTDLAAITGSTRHLDALVRGQSLLLRFDDNAVDEVGDVQAYVFPVNAGDDALTATGDGVSGPESAAGQPTGSRMHNLAVLESGLARCAVKPPNVRHEAELFAAQDVAQRQGRGLWAVTPPATSRDAARRRHGFSIGLFSRQDDYDYRRFLRELVDIGASDVMLITPWFLETHESLSIKRRQFRSCPIQVVETVANQAREAGLRVTLMPIVLLTNAPTDKWRGNIAPPDLDDWFSGYTEFILPFADLARRTGAEMLTLGSEFSSLEKHTTPWRYVVKNARARYGGLLTYSANWDHVDVIKWWKDIDVIGMTGYHSLAKTNDPTVADLTACWTGIRKKLVTSLSAHEMPYLFTEMGYASLDGINKDPWDYVSPKTVDDQEQADCYEAWTLAWRGAPESFKGAFFYTWWRNDDADDAKQYTVRGKPAEAVIRRYFKSLNEGAEGSR